MISPPKTECPEPGIYENIPHEVYRAWDAVSNSRLGWAEKSLAHFKANSDGKETKARLIGSFLHCLQLEPEEVERRFAVMPSFELDADNTTANGKPSTSKSTSYYKDRKREFEEESDGKSIVSQDDFDEVSLMVGGVAANHKSRELLERCTRREVSAIAVDPLTGLRIKCRFDALGESDFCDLKTTIHAADFEKDIFYRGYHRQTELYQRVARAALGVELTPHLIAIDKERPYLSRTAPVSEEFLDIGRKANDELLSRVAAAYETDHWPGYADPDSWFPPDWALTESESFGDWLNSTIDKEIANV